VPLPVTYGHRWALSGVDGHSENQEPLNQTAAEGPETAMVVGTSVTPVLKPADRARTRAVRTLVSAPPGDPYRTTFVEGRTLVQRKVVVSEP